MVRTPSPTPSSLSPRSSDEDVLEAVSREIEDIPRARGLESTLEELGTGMFWCLCWRVVLTLFLFSMACSCLSGIVLLSCLIANARRCRCRRVMAAWFHLSPPLVTPSIDSFTQARTNGDCSRCAAAAGCPTTLRSPALPSSSPVSRSTLASRTMWSAC